MTYARDRLKFNGWGWEDKTFELDGREEELSEFLCAAFGIEHLPSTPAVDLDEIALPKVGLSDAAQATLKEILGPERVKSGAYERVFHAVGKSYHDLLRVRAGELPAVPDLVVYPESEEELAAVSAFAVEHQVALIPFGGGSSVVGGVEALKADGQVAIITVDLTRMNQFISLDEESMLATAQAGIYGPELERQLAERGYTLGHYPQSFEFSTLGGWVAARGSGQQSSGYGGAEKWMVAARLVTPEGVLETKHFPRSSSGPDLNHAILGSEGALGFISEVTFRIRKLPPAKDYRAFLFPDFASGAEAIRQANQEGVKFAMMRLSDADETYFFGKFKSLGKQVGWGRKVAKRALGFLGMSERPCVLMLGLEGESGSVTAAKLEMTSICVKHGGVPVGTSAGKSWYEGRFEMPYLRDPLMDLGVGVDTLETATSWANLHRLHQAVRESIASAIGRDALVLAHISHSYPDGASLYFTFAFPMESGQELEQWRRIKKAASDTIRDHGGTISHHHGVGADHLPWMQAEKTDAGIALLRGAKAGVDPHGVMNPGKLIPTP